VKPAVRRKQVQHLVSGKLLSERRACGLVGISRSVVQYNSRRRCDATLRLRLKELAERYQPPATFAKLQARRFQSPAAPSANLPVAEKAVA